jgi:glycolate oxidase FAD binding subunit
MEWGNAPRGLDLLVSMRAMGQVLEHAWADLTATAEAGCTVADLQRKLAEHGQRLAIDPLFPERATIGGILATNDSGALRTRFGSLRDLLIGITAVLPDGTIARSGGKVVKNVAGYDLPKLFTGSLGTLGVIAQATFRLHPLPGVPRSLTFQLPTAEQANQLLLRLQDSTLAYTSLQVRAARERPAFVDIRFEGISASVEAQTERALLLVKGQVEEPGVDVWRLREELWMRTECGCICRFSVLPSQIAGFLSRMDQLADECHLDWRVVVQAVGSGLVRLEGDPVQLASAVETLRAGLASAGGSLVILRCPDELRSRVDAWGAVGSALPLMRRIKEKFDPSGIINPGRFAGGI